MAKAANPGVPFPPPALFVAGLVAGLLLERAFPLPIATAGRGMLLGIGWATVTAGAAALLWALATFWRVRTGIYPNQPASTVVDRGPYRYSRNPMYVALTVMAAGLGLIVNTVWILVMLPVVLMALTRLVIRREERYLLEAFGPRYRDYQARVRRWL